MTNLMNDQIANELALYARRIPWKTGAPPRAGEYLVTVANDEQRWTRYEYFDGTIWPRAGGYATVVAWDYMPRPYTEDR
jgi:hypothetical protein